MTEVTRSFCWHQNFVPWGLYAPAPGQYTCIKSWKKLYLIRLQRDFFETCNSLSLPRGYIHVLSHEKNCIKSDFKDIFLKLATKEWSDKTFLLTLKLCPLGAVCPCPGAIYMYKTMKKKCIKSTSKRFFKLATNDRSDKMFLLTSIFHPQGVASPSPGAIYMYKIMKKIV